MITDHKESLPFRIGASCDTCKQSIDAPNKGMGRAMVAAWKTQHQHKGRKS